jgi:hypothetical protein
MAIGLGMAVAGAQPAPAPHPAAPVAGTNGVGPKIWFATPVYDFGRARAGEPVKYTYVFTNIGDETLILANVQPQCGCTSAGEWTKQVPPGQTGSIPIQFNTVNFNGTVSKRVTVASNDKFQPMLFLQIRGAVFRPLDMDPQLAVMNLPPDASAGSLVITITNNTEEPLTLSEPQSNNPRFTAELKTVAPGKGYRLAVSTVPPLTPGGIQAQISMKSSWTNQPVINVTVYANIQPAIVVIPSHITLPPGPLASALTPSVMVQNNSTNVLSLRGLSVNAPGVKTQIKETEPGRSFTALATFPQGFELRPGQLVELTVKSSNPKYPVVKVPVTQLPRAATPAQLQKPPTAAAVQSPPAL